MTLAQIIERLERIERFDDWLEVMRGIAELKRDLEMALIKAGQL